MRGAAGRARSILRQYSGISDFAWRYVLNARPTLLHGLRERPVGGEFVGIRHRSIFGSREPGVPREVVAMA